MQHAKSDFMVKYVLVATLRTISKIVRKEVTLRTDITLHTKKVRKVATSLTKTVKSHFTHSA